MNIDIHPDIQSDIDAYGLEYGVYATTCTPYRGDRHVQIQKDEPELISAPSIEELYERMAKCRIDHMLRGEKDIRESHRHLYPNAQDDYTVEFTPIFVVVEWFSKDKLEESKTYQDIGKARDEARAAEKHAQEVEAKRLAEWRKADQERRDREEFERLSKKFSK